MKYFQPGGWTNPPNPPPPLATRVASGTKNRNKQQFKKFFDFQAYFCRKFPELVLIQNRSHEVPSSKFIYDRTSGKIICMKFTKNVHACLFCLLSNLMSNLSRPIFRFLLRLVCKRHFMRKIVQFFIQQATSFIEFYLNIQICTK